MNSRSGPTAGGSAAALRLPRHNIREMKHDTAYRGIASGTVAITDLYTADAEIDYYRLRPLEDVPEYFHEYNAVIIPVPSPVA